MKRILGALVLCVSLVYSTAYSEGSKKSPFSSSDFELVSIGSDQAILFTCEILAMGTYTMTCQLPEELSLAQGQQPVVTAAADSGETITATWTIVPSIDGVFMIEVGLQAAITTNEERYAKFHSEPCYVEVSAGIISYGSQLLPPQYYATGADPKKLDITLLWS